jgi:sugar lactone lactonase YvrE
MSQPPNWTVSVNRKLDVNRKEHARIRHALASLFSAGLLVAAAAAPTAQAAAAHGSGHGESRGEVSRIVLSGATSAEGIAAGRGRTFYAGDLFAGDIYRGNLRRGTADLFIDAPQGRQAVGMAFSRRSRFLFVAGGFTGQGYVYDTRTGATVADYQFGPADTAFPNDVALTREGAYFTDSLQAKLYFVPLDRRGRPGPFRTLELSGPAADLPSQFNLNGIQATEDGDALIVAHTGNAALYTVDPATGTSAVIAGADGLTGVDGLVLEDDVIWAVQNATNQVTRIRLDLKLDSGVVEKTITSDLFQTCTTAALFGDTLAVVNAKFDTGFPPTAEEYDVILVDG